jgi:predicted dehydrogenase
MAAKTIGIIVNGATGGIANRQHLDQALVPLIREGGLETGTGRIVPELLLVGRDAGRLEAVARRFGLARWTTDLDGALADPDYPVFFDAGVTGARPGLLAAAIGAGKHVYAEKPVVTDLREGRRLVALAEARGVRHGVVEDKLFLPGLAKLRLARDGGFFGRVVGFRLDFGYWIFSGHDQPMQRPSWNYRAADGGGLMLDMYPHWRYVIEGLLGPIARVVSRGWTAVPERVDEAGRHFAVDVDDSNVTLVELASGAVGVITSSWATRVNRDDLMTLQVDGTAGSAVAGLHRCRLQPAAATPKVRFDPNVDHGVDYRAQWLEMPETLPFANGYRRGWEAFLRHVAEDAPPAATLEDGLRDVALARAVQRSAAEDRWVAMDEVLVAEDVPA